MINGLHAMVLNEGEEDSGLLAKIHERCHCGSAVKHSISLRAFRTHRFPAGAAFHVQMHTFYVIETPKPTNQAKLCTFQNKRLFSITKWGDECFMNFRSKPCVNLFNTNNNGNYQQQ